MKKLVVFTLHLGYWMMYLLMLILLLRATQAHRAVNLFPGWTMINVFLSSAVIPALLGFYASYGFLFPRFLKKKKFIGLLLSGLLIYFTSALIQDIF